MRASGGDEAVKRFLALVVLGLVLSIPSGTRILAVHAVQRIPIDPTYQPLGRFSEELPKWYGWSAAPVFQKVHLKLQAPAGQTLMVIDATDSGDVVTWLGLPYRLGSESRADTGEPHADPVDNPDCTQAFTYPFALAIHEDQGRSRRRLAQVQPGFSRQEHRRDYSLQRFPMFAGKSFFHYRRIVSQGLRNPFTGQPRWGEITAVNWNRGNDWSLMDPPLLMSESQLIEAKQRQNWLGGLNLDALREAENHALLFAEWLLETQSTSRFPLSYLAGSDGVSLMGTQSGLSMIPYSREGRRIRGRAAYGQPSLLLREQDIRVGYRGRDFSPTVVGVAHYAIDIHGCRYRDGRPSQSATSASVNEYQVRPILLPLESLIPQTIDNLLIGGKAIAVSHIVNAATRSHYGEWTIGAAAGSTAGWITAQKQPDLTPISLLTQGRIRELQAHLRQLGIRLGW